MKTYSAAKKRLLAHLDLQDAHGAFSDEAFAELGRLVNIMRAESPVMAPLDELEFVEGRWETTFAHFGGKRSAGKSKIHDSTLFDHSFNRFPAVPIRVTRLCQEISAAENAYNNLVDFTAADGRMRGLIITRGRYRADPENRQRFYVEFYRIELVPGVGFTEAQLRAALSSGDVRLSDEQSLFVDLKPPRLHSDVVYLDEDMRINIGGLGGMYVLRRCNEKTVSF